MAFVSVGVLGPSVAAAADTYVVHPGDTLTGIALRYKSTPAALAALNRLGLPDLLLVGQRVKVPHHHQRGAAYRVEPGDTLTALARRFGTSVAALARANVLDSSGLLLAGTTLRVPHNAAPVVDASRPPNVGIVPDLVRYWAARYHVRFPLVLGVAWMESGYQNDVVSLVGAGGIMQVTAPTWDFVETVLLGRPVAHTADGNVRVGVSYLHHLLHAYDGDERLALAAYYQGPRSVRKYGAYPLTVLYIDDVLALASRVS